MTRPDLLIVVFLALGVSAHGAADPVAKCQALKMKAAGKKTFDKAKCYQKALLKAVAVDPDCLTKAETKFTAAVAKADAAGTCSGDAPSLELAVDTAVAGYLAAVTDTCAGQDVGGFCWFLGAAGESCDTVCAGQGKLYDAATATYAGSGGTDAQCEAVLIALGLPGPHNFSGTTSCAQGFGCANSSSGSLHCDSPATTAGASTPTLSRACACV